MSRRASGWMKTRDRLPTRISHIDIDAYNANLRTIQDANFSRNRILADRAREDRELENQIKEVWE